MENKLKTLQGIFDGCGLEYNTDDFDFTQPDAMDESGSGGAWDMAELMAQEIIASAFGQEWFDEIENANEKHLYAARDTLQSLLYNLFCAYKTETDDDEQ